jgi:two-component system NtrC family sensor kinase
MPDYYRAPTLVLLLILVIVFVFLYARSRTPRLLLWLLGWCMASAHLALEIFWRGQGPYSLAFAISNVAMLAGAVMFLASLSTLSFGKLRKVPYTAAFIVPLALYALLASIRTPSAATRVTLLLSAAAAAAVATHWSFKRYILERWIPVSLAIVIGSGCLWLTWAGSYQVVIFLAQAGIHLVTALLFLTAYRQFTPGKIFTALGFLVWTIPLPLHMIFQGNAELMVMIGRGANLLKVVTAMGMIVLVLEQELAANRAAKERDSRARHELECYAGLNLPPTMAQESVENSFDELCGVVADASRFSRVVLMLRSMGQNFYISGSAGMDAGMVEALRSLATRTTPEMLDNLRKDSLAASELTHSPLMDLRRLFAPDDDVEKLAFSSAYILPIYSRSRLLDGALLLAGVKGAAEPLRTDDFLPLELLASRISAARESGVLMRRVIRSEKLAGLGQLAGGVAHELNNPLTVVMGYAELLEDDAADERSRKGASIIRSEAQRMKQIIESLVRFWRPAPQEHQPIDIDTLLRDVERLRRPEFARAGIDFRLSIEVPLPRAYGNSDQIRQVILMVLNNAVEAVQAGLPDQERQIRVGASRVRDRVQITVADSGRGFADPNRAFDPFFTTKAPGEGPGLGLSICYSIIREHHGEITAYNLQPHGGALAIELPCGQPKSDLARAAGQVAISS